VSTWCATTTTSTASTAGLRTITAASIPMTSTGSCQCSLYNGKLFDFHYIVSLLTLLREFDPISLEFGKLTCNTTQTSWCSAIAASTS